MQANQAAVDDLQAAMRPLTGYDNRALREMVEDDTKVEEFVKTIDLTTRKTMVGQNEMIMAQNRSLAEYNLSLEPVLEGGKTNLKQLMRQIEEVRTSVMHKEEKLRSNSSSVTAETALALLQTSAAESEEDSEKLADLFYQKEMDVEEFLDKFQDTRKRMHLRRVKAEKMVELVSQKGSRPVSAGNHRRAAPPPPYPVGPNSFFNNNI